METKPALEKTKSFIYQAYNLTQSKLANNIYRGHLRSLSTEIEDSVALFVSYILPECKVFIDSSIHIDHKNNRPDILILNDKNEVIAMLEIKANMGWNRDAKGVIDNIILNDEKFKNERTLFCEFSNEENEEVKYGDSVKLFLVSLTSWNCPQKKHDKNKAYADAVKVHYYNLFSGWYDELFNGDIEEFANELLK